MEEIVVTKDSILNTEDWKLAGSPIMWLSVEVDGDYEAQIDVAYGGLRLLKGGVEISRTSQAIIAGEECVVLDKDYYGLKKYIWK